jgi:FkbM family methyltransferase
MSLLSRIKRVVKLFLYRRIIADSYWAAILLDNEIPTEAVHFDTASDKLQIRGFSIGLARNKHVFLVRAYPYLKALKERAGADLRLTEQGDVLLSVEGIEVVVDTYEEIGVVWELYVNGTYNYIAKLSTPCIVWDIGMNIGIASLLLASKPEVVAVFGYEPFVQTYNKALVNFKYNPERDAKIRPFNYGIAAETKSLMVSYSYQWKAHAGVGEFSDSMKALIERSGEKIIQEEIQLRSALEVLSELRTEFPGADIIAKIDCEGAEYEIFEVLEANNLLRCFKIIMLEWHVHGPDRLAEALIRSGFSLFHFPLTTEAGMLYGVRLSADEK